MHSEQHWKDLMYDDFKAKSWSDAKDEEDLTRARESAECNEGCYSCAANDIYGANEPDEVWRAPLLRAETFTGTDIVGELIAEQLVGKCPFCGHERCECIDEESSYTISASIMDC